MTRKYQSPMTWAQLAVEIAKIAPERQQDQAIVFDYEYERNIGITSMSVMEDDMVNPSGDGMEKRSDYEVQLRSDDPELDDEAIKEELDAEPIVAVRGRMFVNANET